jgi:hypothetical protein
MIAGVMALHTGWALVRELALGSLIGLGFEARCERGARKSQNPSGASRPDAAETL